MSNHTYYISIQLFSQEYIIRTIKSSKSQNRQTPITTHRHWVCGIVANVSYNTSTEAIIIHNKNHIKHIHIKRLIIIILNTSRWTSTALTFLSCSGEHLLHSVKRFLIGLLAFTLRYFTMRFLSSTHIHVYIYININSSYIDYQH